MKINNSKMSATDTVEKICIICGDKYTCSARTRKSSKFCSSKCRSKNANKKKNDKLEDYVICPICGEKYREINNAHIWFHNMTIDEWKEKFPDFDNLSKTSRLKKATLKNVTKEQSKKLRKGHTLEGYIEKYGEYDGKIKYVERCENIKYARTREYYIEKYGEVEYKKMTKNRGVTLEKYIKKYGEIEGKTKYDKWLENNRKSSTLLGYLEKHGEKEGYKKWFSKNKKNSISSSHINVEDIDDYKKYCMEVDKETRISLQLNKLENIELRSREYHLDHKVSKCYGFNNNISAKIIGSINNLEIITANENLSKQKHCSMDIDDLIRKIKK